MVAAEQVAAASCRCNNRDIKCGGGRISCVTAGPRIASDKGPARPRQIFGRAGTSTPSGFPSAGDGDVRHLMREYDIARR